MDSFALKDLLTSAAPRRPEDHLQALLCGRQLPSLVPSIEAQVASNALLKELVLTTQAPPPSTSSPPPQQKTTNATIWQNLQSAAPPPSAEALVAKSLLSAKPSPFLPPGRTNPPLKQLQWDEEGQFAHWPVDDEAVFYKMTRLSPSAEALGRRGYFDLNIVMPIVIPKAEIRVIDPDGENYYNLADSNPGAHLLFGRTSSQPAAATSGGTGGLQTDDENFAVKPPADTNSYPAVCDVWASFLNVQLGTIRNCRGDQVIEVCQLFNHVFGAKEDDASAPYFLVPITIDCRGICPRTGSNKSGTQERYETKGTLLTENDRNRFRIIRRKLKKFVLLLWQEFGVQSDVNSPFKFDCALHDNCKSHNADGIRIEIRRYSPLTHPDLLKHIWKENARVAEGGAPTSTVFELNELAPVSAQTRIVVNEVRLEMTHARMIDPRWTSQWVLARRMPATPPTANSPPMFARHVFCSRVETPRVVYEFAHPRRALLDSRFAPLYLLADTSSRDSISAEEAKRKLRQAKQQMSAAAVPFFPLSGVLGKLGIAAPSSPGGPVQEEGSPPPPDASTPPRVSAWDRLVTSATLAGLPDQSVDLLNQLMRASPFDGSKGATPPAMRTRFSSPPHVGTPGYRAVPLTEEPCRFFQLGSCARGDECFFLHPADPQLESVADVRHLSPSNPIFF